jgi:glycosyltransferase involved in cell wall biosynthesis
MKPLRLAYLTTRYPDVSHTFVHGEIERLRACGIQIESFSVWEAKQERLLSESDQAAYRATYHFLPPTPLGYARAAFALLRALTAPARALAALRHGIGIGSRPGVRGRLLPLLWFLEAAVLREECRRRSLEHVHAHFGGAPSSIACIASRLAGADSGGRRRLSWSATIHGPADFLDLNLGHKMTDASFVVCISDFGRSQLMAGLPEDHWENIHVIHCGINPTAFPLVPERTREPGDTGFRILSVGRLVPFKGQAVLLDAIRLLADAGVDARLTLVGGGPSEKRLKAHIRKLGIADRVTLPGPVAHEKVPSYLADADVFCMSSFLEGVPVAVMEAMASGRAVVAPRIAGIPELIEDGANGLIVSPGRPDQLAGALRRLAQDPELRTRLATAGRERVIDDFNTHKSAAQLAELLGRSVGGPAMRHGQARASSNGTGPDDTLTGEVPDGVLTGIGVDPW